MVVCTFAGHREVFGLGQSQVVEILERLLEVEQEMTCYVGGKGEFDALCASAVRTLKHRHPDKAISLVLMLPYMEQRLNTDKELDYKEIGKRVKIARIRADLTKEV